MDGRGERVGLFFLCFVPAFDAPPTASMPTVTGLNHRAERGRAAAAGPGAGGARAGPGPGGGWGGESTPPADLGLFPPPPRVRPAPPAPRNAPKNDLAETGDGFEPSRFRTAVERSTTELTSRR